MLDLFSPAQEQITRLFNIPHRLVLAYMRSGLVTFVHTGDLPFWGGMIKTEHIFDPLFSCS